MLPQQYKADIQLSIGFIRKRKVYSRPVFTHISLDMFAGKLASLMIDLIVNIRKCILFVTHKHYQNMLDNAAQLILYTLCT